MASVRGTGRYSSLDAGAYVPILAHGTGDGEELKTGGDGAIEMLHMRSRSSSSSSASSTSSTLCRSRPRKMPSWPYSAAEEQAVVRKFDRRLVLFVAALYLLSFLDRSNIGNARIAGMDADLQLAHGNGDGDDNGDGYGNSYEWALTAFYVTYIAFEWMALLWRVVPAHMYVAALVAGWGIAASLQALAPSYAWLIAMRMLLGVGEAGFAGIPLYLAQFFRRDELALRTAMFIAAAPLATAFAASLAWAILALAQHVASPIAPWRLLFLVEGFPSVVMAVVAWRVLPDAPDTAHYLTRREKKLARLRLARDAGGGGGGDDDAEHAGHIDCDNDSGSTTAALADPVSWTIAAMFFLANMAYSSLPVFLPTILTDMGHDAVAAQALAAPPYLVAFVVVLATAHVSDRTGVRAPFLVGHALASAAGYGVLSIDEGRLLGRSSVWRYLAVYPAAVGFFNVVVLLIAWNLGNQRGVRRQGAAFALFQAVGQCGPLVGTRMYPVEDAPLFLRGMRTMAAAMVGVAVLGMVLRAVLQRRNAVLDAQDAEQAKEDDAHGEADGLVSTSKAAGPRGGTSFRFML